jgi:thymidylate kinase
MYIAIEGVKGSGKSTIIDRIIYGLKLSGCDLKLIAPTRSPKGFSLIESISSAVPWLLMCDYWNEILYAVRSNREARRIKKQDHLLLGDRSIATSYVTRWNKYGDPNKCISRVNAIEPLLLAPDHILYLDVTPETALSRIRNRPKRNYGLKDETESRVVEAIDNYKSVMAYGIKRLSNTVWHSIDANKKLDEVLEQIKPAIENLASVKINL